MRISNFYLETFRNIRKADVDFDKLNIITGRNSSGKTNLLLAIAHAINTEPDFSLTFFDNAVTYGQGIRRTILKSTLTDLHTTNWFYVNGKQCLFFEPRSLIFENTISKQCTSTSHKLRYTGEFGNIEWDFVKAGSLPTSDDLKKEKKLSKLENALVYERTFAEDVVEQDGRKIVKKEDTNLPHKEEYFSLFSAYKDSILPWLDSKNFSSALLLKYVTDTYDSEIRQQVFERLGMPEDERARRMVSFQKAKFPFLLSDVQRNDRARKLFNADLKNYTEGAVNEVKIVTEAQDGVKGEMKIETLGNLKDISHISAGTAVLIYFILLKNWLSLPYKEKSFKDPSVMVFDEVDSIIHPSLVPNFVELLNSISKKAQLFISTHSPHFIDHFDKEHVYWLHESTEKVPPKEIGSSIYSYSEIIKRIPEGVDKKYFATRPNSELFINGLFDSIFPR